MQTVKPLFTSETEREQFALALPTQRLGKTICYLPQTTSTNLVLMELLKSGEPPDGLLVIADAQTQGRGRGTRSWHSPFGASLLFSLLIHLRSLPRERLGWFSLATGWAVAEALENWTRIPARIKWPNDIVIPMALSRTTTQRDNAWKKLGGILCESVLSGSTPGADHAIIGIGLNVLQNEKDLPALTKFPATSLQLECSQRIERLDILTQLLMNLERTLQQLNEEESFDALKSHIHRQLLSWWSSGWLEASSPQGIMRGRYHGLGEHGELMLQTEQALIALPDAEILALRHQ